MTYDEWESLIQKIDKVSTNMTILSGYTNTHSEDENAMQHTNSFLKALNTDITKLKDELYDHELKIQ